MFVFLCTYLCDLLYKISIKKIIIITSVKKIKVFELKLVGGHDF